MDTIEQLRSRLEHALEMSGPESPVRDPDTGYRLELWPDLRAEAQRLLEDPEADPVELDAMDFRLRRAFYSTLRELRAVMAEQQHEQSQGLLVAQDELLLLAGAGAPSKKTLSNSKVLPLPAGKRGKENIYEYAAIISKWRWGRLPSEEEARRILAARPSVQLGTETG